MKFALFPPWEYSKVNDLLINLSRSMADTTDPKKTDNKDDNAQGWAFWWVPFDEAQKKKAPDVGFSLDMDDLPDLDDIALDLDDDDALVDVANDADSSEAWWLDATGDLSLDDINLDDISLDDINLDAIVWSDVEETPKVSPEITVEPKNNSPEISLADLYNKPVKKEEATPSVPDFDLGDLDISDEKETLSPAVEAVVPQISADKNIETPSVPEVVTKEPTKVTEKEQSFTPTIEKKEFHVPKWPQKQPDLKKNDSMVSEAPVMSKESDSLDNQKKVHGTKPAEKQLAADVVKVPAVVAWFRKVDLPLWASKVIKKFIEVLNIIREGFSLMNAWEKISVVWIHTDKQHIAYDFSHDDDKSFKVLRKATDPSTQEKSTWYLTMAYDGGKKNFDLTLDDVVVYTEEWDVVSDKNLQHTVTDKLGKFALLLSEFVRKKKKKKEELLRAEEEKKKQRDVAKKLREF